MTLKEILDIRENLQFINNIEDAIGFEYIAKLVINNDTIFLGFKNTELEKINEFLTIAKFNDAQVGNDYKIYDTRSNT